MSLDKTAIKNNISSAKAQDILHLTSNAADKKSVQSVLSEIEKFIAKGICTITVVRKP
jgi:vacuolar-type H+-ATPase subunit H